MNSGVASTARAVVKDSCSPLPDRSLPCHHSVQFYYDDRFLVRSVSDFVSTALKTGRSAVVVATGQHRFDVAESLRRAGINLTLAISQGRYVTLDASETLERFMVNGAPDAKLFEKAIGEMLVISSDRAWPAGNSKPKIAVFGEMVALLLQRGEVSAAVCLEQLWNQLSKDFSFDLLCAYPISSFDRDTHTELFRRICAEHDVVIPAEGYPEQGDENDRLRMIALLQQKEQLLKTETSERRLAEAQTREAESQKEKLVREIRKHETAEEELRNFTRRLLTARDEEQRRIAAELHENMAQLVAALSAYVGVLHQEKASLNPRLARAVASSRAVSDNLLDEIGKLSRLLHPPTLDDMGVASALKEYIENMSRHGAKVELEVSPNIGRFNRELEITVYRIVEEAIEQVPTSPEAHTVVRLMRSESSLLLEIESPRFANGNEEAGPRPESQFTGIHERVLEHRGSVHFTSSPSGTLLSVALPLDAKASKSLSPTISPLLQKIG